jgi:hypothetical protein
MKRFFALLAPLAVLASCATDASWTPPGPLEQVGTQKAALNAPTLSPVPCVYNGTSYVPVFDGTTPELYFADAYAECTANLPYLIQGMNASADDSFTSQINLDMNFAVFSADLPVWKDATLNSQEQWIKYRSSGVNECDPTTMQPTNQPVPLRPLRLSGLVDYAVIPPSTAQPSPSELAERDISEAELNLCIAQSLRSSIAGAASGAALLFSDSDQRELLEIIRERAQIAMLQYALLGETFALPNPLTTPFEADGMFFPGLTLSQVQNGVQPVDSTGEQFQERLPALTYFAYHGTGVSQLQQMGQDFAASIQLHTYVTEELAALFARSRSAHLPRSAQVLGPADELWGQGSWFHREMALMFGGDPLAIQTPTYGGSGAWISATSQNGRPGGNATNLDWPTFEQVPYFHTAIDQPQVLELLKLAQSFDDVYLQGPSTGFCSPYSVQNTANWIYGNVELDLETKDCDPQVQVNNTCPAARTAPKTPRSIAGAPDNTWLLWTKYGITPDHANTLASYLNDGLSFQTTEPMCPASLHEAELTGALQVGGHDPSGVTFDSTTGHVSPKATLQPRALADVEGAFSRIVPRRFPSPYDMLYMPGVPLWHLDVGHLQFDGNCNGSASCGFSDSGTEETKRIMGAVAAQVATRDMLLSTIQFLNDSAQNANTGLLQTYLANAEAMIGVLTGATGTSVSVTPVAVAAFQQDPQNNNGFVDTMVPATSAGNAKWNVVLTLNASDSWWKPLTTANSGATYSLYAITGAYAGDLAAHPEASIVVPQTQCNSAGVCKVVPTTLTLGSLISTAKNAGFWSNLSPLYSDSASGLVRIGTPVVVPADTGVTLVVERDTASDVEYEVVAPNLTLSPLPSTWISGPKQYGQYLAVTGALGSMAAHQAAVSASNPIQPAYDGFDIPNPWVPPFNAELLGGSASDTSVTAYLNLAQTAAQTAAMAVETALNDLQQQAVDQATAQAAAVKASQTVQSDKDALCGIGNMNCDETVLTTAVPANFYPSPNPPACTDTPDACAVAAQLDAVVAQATSALSNAKFEIADEVYNNITAAAPSFSNYNGGSLQSAFITQWQALQAPISKIQSVISTVGAAKAQIHTAQVQLATATQQQQHACDPGTFAAAMAAGVSTSASVSVGVSAGFAGASVSASASFGVSVSPEPLFQQAEKCTELSTGLAPTQAQAVQAMSDAFSSVSSALVGFSDSVAAIVQSGATVESLLAKTTLADRQAQLEQQLTQSTLQTSTGIYRMYRSSDMWRAKALIDSARTYALAARRAIEARYVVDLSRMSDPEPFVASPSIWADQVYTYDLNMPAAVGLNVSAPSSGTVYSNQVADYVSNLQSFISGYAAKRPAAVASNELDLVTLPGMAPEVICTPGDTSCTPVPAPGPWAVHCPGANAWTTGSVDTVCGNDSKGNPISPDEVRLDFSLDPWGRVNGGITNSPFVDRYNSRWGNLALNFVGTGIKNCLKAADPQGCYADESIPYTLTHSGPSWVTDYSEVWRLLNTPAMTIEGGKGLAAEIWLDPLQDGWSTSFIAPILRTEYTLAPLGGYYELDFQVPPEVVLDQIQRIQILEGSTAWVKEGQ